MNGNQRFWCLLAPNLIGITEMKIKKNVCNAKLQFKHLCVHIMGAIADQTLLAPIPRGAII